jgi:putative hemolysin
MDDPLLWQLLLQLVLRIVNALFSCAEIALISFSEAKAENLAAAGDKRAQRLLKLKATPEKFLATIQVGITLAGFLASAFAASNFATKIAHFFESLNIGIKFSVLQTASLILITIILSLFTIVLGELLPKRIAMKKADTLAYIVATPISIVSAIFSPLISLLSLCTNAMLRLFRLDPSGVENEITEEEIRLMVNSGSAHGAIEEREKEIINNVFEFDDKNAGDLMTHRMDTVILWIKDDDKTWEKTIIEKKFDHYPVCGETIDDIKGVLSTRDFLLLNSYDRKTVMEKAVYSPQFVPESIKADVLFAKMKQTRNRYAFVLDEYGGFNGIITMNDVLAAIVGEFC